MTRIPHHAVFFLAIAALTCFAPRALADGLNPAIVTGANVLGCPCDMSGFSSDAVYDAGTQGVLLLSNFGDSYNVTSFDTNLEANGVSTPGMMTSGPGGIGTSSIIMVGFPQPTLSAQTNSAGQSIAAGGLDYYFEVVPDSGATGASPVNVGIAATASISATTGAGSQSASVQAELIIPGVLTDNAQIEYSVGGCPSLPQIGNTSTASGAGFVSTPGANGAAIGCGGSNMSGGFNQAGTYGLSTNTIYEVELIGGVDETSNGSGSAFIDPMITVPAGFTLDLSAGVGNGGTPAVPEPGTWPLLAGAFVILMVARRRFTRATRSSVPAQ